jgi:glucose-1-phosphate adenylyltransferase
MELIDLVPEFNLYEEFWKIYTKSDVIPPQYIAGQAVVERCIIGEGAEIYGEIYNSVIGAGVVIEEGAIVRDSIIMKSTVIGRNTKVYKAIIAENCVIGADCWLGVLEEVPNVLYPNIYCDGLVTIGEESVIPEGITIGKNTAISGITKKEDYKENLLFSGQCLIKAGGIV